MTTKIIQLLNDIFWRCLVIFIQTIMSFLQETVKAILNPALPLSKNWKFGIVSLFMRSSDMFFHYFITFTTKAGKKWYVHILAPKSETIWCFIPDSDSFYWIMNFTTWRNFFWGNCNSIFIGYLCILTIVCVDLLQYDLCYMLFFIIVFDNHYSVIFYILKLRYWYI